MKILLLTSHIELGGIGFYTVNLAKYLKKNGVDVVVASSGGALLYLLDVEGIRHVRMNIRAKFEFGPKVWAALPSLIRMIKREGFDVVHAQTRTTQVLACLAKSFTGVPIVTTCHGAFNHKRLGRILFPCWGDRAIAISRDVKDHLVNDLKVAKEKVRQVYTGIELERFKRYNDAGDPALKDRLGFGEKDVVVGSIGRYSPVKGFKVLIRAFSKVLERDPCVKLLLVGDGPEKNSLIELVSELGIRRSVVLDDGSKAPREDYFKVINIFCVPSLAEGLGLSAMEAMASGRACVASAVGGLPEVIESGKDGLLVEPGDEEGLAQAVIRLLDDTGLRSKLAGEAEKKAFRDFSAEDWAEKIIRVYEEVIEIA